MALALPLSTGKHSHSNPFYLEFYDKGRMQTRLGAIDSLSISHGDGTMGFTPGLPAGAGHGRPALPPAGRPGGAPLRW